MSNGFNSKVDMENVMDDIKDISLEAVKITKEINGAIKGHGLYDSRSEFDDRLENQIQDMRKEEDRLQSIRDREEAKVEKEFDKETPNNNKQEKTYDYDMER